MRRRRTIDPLEQGHLDALCGVYSVINAIRLAAHHGGRPLAWLREALRDGWEDALFSHLMRSAAQGAPDSEFVYAGLESRQLANLVRSASEWLVDFFNLRVTTRRPLYRRPAASLPLRCRVIAAHLEQAATAVIIGTAQPWNHWTVVARVERNRLVLFDSGGQRYALLRKRRRYDDCHAGLITPDKVFLLTIEPSD